LNSVLNSYMNYFPFAGLAHYNSYKYQSRVLQSI
jgi:hypothetical protein